MGGRRHRSIAAIGFSAIKLRAILYITINLTLIIYSSEIIGGFSIIRLVAIPIIEDNLCQIPVVINVDDGTAVCLNGGAGLYSAGIMKAFVITAAVAPVSVGRIDWRIRNTLANIAVSVVIGLGRIFRILIVRDLLAPDNYFVAGVGSGRPVAIKPGLLGQRQAIRRIDDITVAVSDLIPIGNRSGFILAAGVPAVESITGPGADIQLGDLLVGQDEACRNITGPAAGLTGNEAEPEGLLKEGI